MGDGHVLGPGLTAATNQRIRDLLAAGQTRLLGRPRPADAERARLRSPAGRGRGRQGRRADRHDRRHGRAARRHPARQGQPDPHHRQRHRPDRRRPVRGRRRGAGYSPDDFKVLLQNDVLKEYLARGTRTSSRRPPGVEFCVDVIEYCARTCRTGRRIEFCGYHVRDTGSSAVQELAIALSNGRAYIDAALRRGLAIDEFASGIYLFLAARHRHLRGGRQVPAPPAASGPT